MTVVGSGGVVVRRWQKTRRFEKDYRKLRNSLQEQVEGKLKDLCKDPRPAGLRFEKLVGYASPAIYTIHITGNYKLSMVIDGDLAILRRVAPHDDIDRAP